MKKILTGITWDHERGYAPLVAVSGLFEKSRPDIEVRWKRRSLKDFGDYPLEKLIPEYDMVMLDHPFTGEALVENLLLPLNSLIGPEHLAVQRRESLGPCYDSYLQNGQVMALPVDAAALVSAARHGKVPRTGIPRVWDDLLRFCEDLGRDSVAVPLCAVDIWCVYLTLNALCLQTSDSVTDFFTDEGLCVENSVEALEKLYELLSLATPSSLEMNPIGLFEAMAGGRTDIVYTPFAFGYTNYSRSGYRGELLEFFDAPTMGRNSYSSLLGGVGIGISAQTGSPEEAAEFIRLLTTADIQKGIFTESGGQPAHKSAWLSEENNILCRNFFKNTYATLERAYIRPRVPKFNRFQEQASGLLHRAVQEKRPPKQITAEINGLYTGIIGANHVK